LALLGEGDYCYSDSRAAYLSVPSLSAPWRPYTQADKVFIKQKSKCEQYVNVMMLT
jgi:hypothetical protein